MKLARFDAGAGSRIGLVEDDSVVDLAQSGVDHGSMLSLIAAGQNALDQLRDLSQSTAAHHRLADIRLLAPLEKPGKYLGIGMNYKSHIAEAERMGFPPPEQQLWFNKQTSCVAGPYDVIEPGVSERLDYEVELGVVIGKTAKGVKAQDAHKHIFGYVVANDVSARDWQAHSPTFTMGKSFDTHGPIGPWIVTADEIADPHDLNIRCLVNGEVRQSSHTGQMLYDILAQIEYLSTAFTLDPGDLFITGTPEGVGAGMDPPCFLKAGDVVRCEIDGIGVIENTVAG